LIDPARSGSPGPPSERALAYERAVLGGRIAAGGHLLRALRRAADDRRRSRSRRFRWRYDARRADHAGEWIETLRFTRGDWRGRPLRLEGWQAWIVCQAFGWVGKKTPSNRRSGVAGRRRFRRVYIEVARKNGKSELLGAIALYLLAADGEPTPEIYVAATSEAQAQIVYKRSKAMARLSPALRKHYGLTTLGSEFSSQLMACRRTDGEFRPLSWTPEKLDGRHVHAAILDEFHAHRSAAMWDVINTATGARAQSMVWAITTAGADTESVCHGQRLLATRVLRGDAEGDRLLAAIWCVDFEGGRPEERDNLQNPECWVKANPNLGVSVSAEVLKDHAEAAKHDGRAAKSFATKHMNVWLRGALSWMHMPSWSACADPAGGPGEEAWAAHAGEEVWIALDLGAVSDMTSMCYAFRGAAGEIRLKWRNYIPRLAAERSKVERLAEWIRDGWVEEAGEDRFDQEALRDRLRIDAERYRIRAIGYDPWEASALVAWAKDHFGKSVEIQGISQTARSLSAPTKEFEAAVRGGRIVHDGNPASAWMIGNTVVKQMGSDNIRPDKLDRSPESRIDAAIAAIMAHHLASTDPAAGSEVAVSLLEPGEEEDFGPDFDDDW